MPRVPRYMSVRFRSGRNPELFSLYNHTTWATQKCFEFHPWKTSKSTPWCFWHCARPFICLRPDTGHRFRTCLYMFPSLFICTFVPLLSSLYLRLPFTCYNWSLFVLKLIHVLCHVMAQNTKHETRNTKKTCFQGWNTKHETRLSKTQTPPSLFPWWQRVPIGSSILNFGVKYGSILNPDFSRKSLKCLSNSACFFRAQFSISSSQFVQFVCESVWFQCDLVHFNSQFWGQNKLNSQFQGQISSILNLHTPPSGPSWRYKRSVLQGCTFSPLPPKPRS